METIQLVTNAALEFPSPEWDSISKEAKDFVRSLLEREPFMRPTAAEALQHAWIAKHNVVAPGIPPPRPFHWAKSSKSSGSSLKISDPDPELRATSESVELRMDSTRRTAFQKFLAGLKIKKAMTGAAKLLTPKEAQQLGEIFGKVDKDRDGRISVVDLDVAVQNPGFSASVKQNLKEMRAHLNTYPRVSFDIKPFMGWVQKRAHSDSTAEDRVLHPSSSTKLDD
jgi:calcium-dependent protein kinase